MKIDSPLGIVWSEFEKYCNEIIEEEYYPEVLPKLESKQLIRNFIG